MVNVVVIGSVLEMVCLYVFRSVCYKVGFEDFKLAFMQCLHILFLHHCPR